MSGGWWNTNWLYRKEIIINHDKISEDLTNFPVLIYNSSDTDLRDHAQDDGDDIVFTDYYGIKLNHEIEYYDNSTAEIVSWVNVTSLSSTNDTILYMYYGNPSCSNQENIVGVWDSQYRMVHHLNETSGMHYDSTSYDNDGTASVTVQGSAVGQIDGSDSFDGVDDYVDCGNDSSLAVSNALSVEAWVKYTEVGSTAWRGIISKNRYFDWVLAVGGTTAPGKADIFITGDLGGTSGNVISTSNINDGIWHHIVGTYDGTTTKIYVDGVMENSATALSGDISTSEEHVTIGIYSDFNLPFNGGIDEARISNIARNNSWINTSYLNQHDPDGFCSIGNEEIQITEQEYSIALHSHWNLISLPFNKTVNKTDIIVSYNNSNYTWQQAVDNTTVLDFIYGWNATIQTYYSAVTLKPGFGYWVWAYAECGLMFSSSVGEDDYITDLELSWNMIGLPSNTSLWKENLIIRYNSTDYSWNKATSNDNEEGEPLILGFIYNWDRIIQNYILSDDFDPGYGYWMYAYYDCTLRKS
jgi:hypothetical protein